MQHKILLAKGLLEQTEREGIDKLTQYLDEIGFFTSPASTKYHGSVEGGLLIHSLEVSRIYSDLNQELKLKLEESSVSIVSLLHDICKAGCYLDNGNKTYKWNDRAPKGHGRLSIERVEKFIKLTEFERLAIRFHMGPWYSIQVMGTDKGEYTILELIDTWKKYPAVRFLYFADEAATQLGT